MTKNKTADRQQIIARRFPKLQPVRSAILENGAPYRIHHGFFTREGGVSQGIYHALNLGLGGEDRLEDVMENRHHVAAFFGVEEPCLVTPHQIHSTHVVVVDKPFTTPRPKADALVSKMPGLVLGVLTADCGPVLFADSKNGIIGAAHAGWRGALYGILEQTIAAMTGIGSQLSEIVAVLGPSISARHYEVGEEFLQLFLDSDPENMVYFAVSDRYGHYFFDLQTYIVDRLERAGVRAATLNLCSYEDERRFYSYRRKTHLGQADFGRQISAIMLEW